MSKARPCSCDRYSDAQRAAGQRCFSCHGLKLAGVTREELEEIEGKAERFEHISALLERLGEHLLDESGVKLSKRPEDAIGELVSCLALQLRRAEDHYQRMDYMLESLGNVREKAREAAGLGKVKRLESTGCIGCPFVFVDEDDSRVRCGADDMKAEIQMSGLLPPKWCPLRTAEVTVSLNQEGQKQ